MNSHIAIWAIFTISIACIIIKPRNVPEWFSASIGAALLAVFGFLPLNEIGIAIGRGTDVYLFLAGMMILAELARFEGVFDWVASHAVHAAHGSCLRFFGLMYTTGILVTVILSNDATAVVLTPAVAAAIKKAKIKPFPYLLACAFIANAASFVLPISNPANLVIFASAIPNLVSWVRIFLLPSFVAIMVTFCILVVIFHRDLRGRMSSDLKPTRLKIGGNLALGGIVLTALILLIASTFHMPLGATTCACGIITLALVGLRNRSIFQEIIHHISWSVLILVAAFFILVQGLDTTGLLQLTIHGIDAIALWPPVFSLLGAAVVTSAASNVINNLPAGLIAGASLAPLHGHAALHAAVAIGIDLGPNLSVTGSLATVLWLIALRREQINVTAWDFLRVGMLVMPPALILSVLSMFYTT